MIMNVEKTIVTAAKELSFPALYHEQKAAITSFVEGNDVFVSLPARRCVLVRYRSRLTA